MTSTNDLFSAQRADNRKRTLDHERIRTQAERQWGEMQLQATQAQLQSTKDQLAAAEANLTDVTKRLEQTTLVCRKTRGTSVAEFVPKKTALMTKEGARDTIWANKKYLQAIASNAASVDGARYARSDKVMAVHKTVLAHARALYGAESPNDTTLLPVGKWVMTDQAWKKAVACICAAILAKVAP